MNRLTKILILLFLVCSAANSAALFEVKNDTGKIIMEVSDDGVRFFNPQYSPVGTEKDTLMIISATNIKALVRKAGGGSASRDFDIADIGSIRKGSGKSVMKMSVNEGYGVGGDSAVVFYKPKNAFRTNSILQDVNLVGDGSFAAGYLNEASGEHSTAFGAYSHATGDRSTAIGVSCTASGETSFATGDDNTASGLYSFAAGQSVVADGVCSIAAGSNSMAFGSSSVAFGSSNEASGNSSAVFGNQNKSEGTSSTSSGNGTTASGQNSFSAGMATNATGPQSFTMGTLSRANGENSLALGYATIAQSYSSLALGTYNKVEGNKDIWVTTDPLFVLGNGTSTTAKSNAFEVKKNGTVYIPSLYTGTIAGEIPSKIVRVDESGRIFSADAKDGNSNSTEISQLKKENENLKNKVENQEERIAKLETIINQLLKK